MIATADTADALAAVRAQYPYSEKHAAMHWLADSAAFLGSQARLPLALFMVCAKQRSLSPQDAIYELMSYSEGKTSRGE